MRVVGGSYSGHKLAVPGQARPTTDRVKESLFASLEAQGFIEDSVVVDLFAGSGALGIEAMSRGASRVMFVEKDKKSALVISANLAKVGLEANDDEVVVQVGLAQSWVKSDLATNFLTKRPEEHLSIVFCDPPYEFDDWANLLELIATKLSCDLVVLESNRKISPTCHFEVMKMREYGTTVIEVLTERRVGESMRGGRV